MSARIMHKVAIAAAVLAFGALAAGFVLKWAAYWQVAAGLATVVAIEWQRREGQKADPSADRTEAE